MRRAVGTALGAAALFLAGYAYERFGKAPTAEELERLRQERRFLSERLGQRLAREVPLLGAAEPSVLVGVPRAFAERLAGDVVTRLLAEVRLTLRDLTVEKEGELRGKIVVGRSLLGRFALRVDLAEVRALLRAGRPRVRFEGNRVAVAVPVSLAEGSGRGRLRFRWDGRGVAGAVCGDLEIEGEVSGTVVPSAYTLRGSFTLAAEGPTLRARPEFEDLDLTVRFEPSKDTWELVEKTIQQQGAVCRAALRAADVPEKVRGLVERGFPVTLPRRIVREVRLPMEVEQTLDVEGTAVRFQVRTTELVLTPARLWYAADVRLAGPPAATPD